MMGFCFDVGDGGAGRHLGIVTRVMTQDGAAHPAAERNERQNGENRFKTGEHYLGES